MRRLLQFMRRLADAVARAGVRHRTLHDLDDATLRDIGVRRSEIASIEAEARRSAAQHTRRRIATWLGASQGASQGAAGGTSLNQ